MSSNAIIFDLYGITRCAVHFKVASIRIFSLEAHDINVRHRIGSCSCLFSTYQSKSCHIKHSLTITNDYPSIFSTCFVNRKSLVLIATVSYFSLLLQILGEA